MGLELDKLEEYVLQRLKNLTDISVYNTDVPSNKTFPYVVMMFTPCSYNVRHRKDWQLELNFWDNKKNNSDLIQASINIKNGRVVDDVEYKGLNNSTQVEDEGFYVANIEFESPISEPEPDICRYNQRYLIKVD
jgi:hypothetical protein